MINFYLFFKNLNKKFYSNLANDKRVKILNYGRNKYRDLIPEV